MDMNFEFDEVVAVEFVECNSLRYDITVQDNHNFFANGLLVHNCQNIQREITDAFNNKDKFEVTVKLDGSSCTVYYNNGEVGVCSRNIDLKLEQEGNAFVDIANNTGLLDALQQYGKNIAVQGELMGPGIQGNREKLNKHELFIFDIYDIDNARYCMTAGETGTRNGIIHQLQQLGYTGNVVPVWQQKYILPTDNIEELLKVAEGPSLNHNVREGLVFKRIDGEFSFKIINNEFLLKDK